MIEQGIGKAIHELRKESGYTQSQLAKGICSVSELAKLEYGEIMLSHLQIDRLFSRLGKAPAKLAYILPKEMYLIYEIRYKIQRSIARGELEQAKEYLCGYEEMKRAGEPLNRQFIEMQRAQIDWLMGKGNGEVLETLQKAIQRTIYDEYAWRKEDALSADELNLLLFRWEVCSEGTEQRAVAELKEILEYCERHCTDQEELAKVYPYAALLIAKYAANSFEENDVTYILKKALDLLREEGKIFLMPEIIEEYVKWVGQKEPSEEVDQFQRAGESLLAVGKLFGVRLKNIRVFEQSNREFELDYEVIHKSRTASGLSQEEVCEGICTRETLSRIERGKTSPTHRNLKKVLSVLKREGERVSTIILADDYSVLEKKRKLVKHMHRLEYDQANEVLEELSQQLDMSIPKNKQYILGERVSQELMRKKLNYQEGLQKLYEILNITLKWQEGEMFEYPLTFYEVCILNEVAILHYEYGKIELAIEVYRKILRNQTDSRLENVFRMSAWETAAANLASLLETTKETAAALSVSRERVNTTMEIGRGVDLGRTLTTMACALEQEHNTDCKQYFEWALHILYLMKNYERYEIVKANMEKPEFLIWMNQGSGGPKGPKS